MGKTSSLDSAGRKRLVIVDDQLKRSNPGISSVVQAIPYLAKLGWEIEVWCNELDQEVAQIARHRKTIALSLPKLPPVLPWVLRHIQDGLRWTFDARKHETVFLTTGGHFLLADVSIFQFYNPSWLRIQREGVESGPDPWYKKWVGLWGFFEDRAMLNLSKSRLLLPASDAIRDDLKRDCQSKKIETLPNCVDLTRFSSSLKAERQDELRDELGMQKNEFIMLFICQGHYTRKGFWLAVKVLRQLHESGQKDFKLLVLGGLERTLNKLRSYLDKEWPEWAQAIQFKGWTNKIPEYMAAADVLFMPSYFEAFSLVEIEAAAMCLPLILTKHHGSEMIIEEGENGVLLSFEISDIVDALGALKDRPLKIHMPNLGRALNVGDFSNALDRHLNNSRKAKILK